jgi:signal transduction histidine kinase
MTASRAVGLLGFNTVRNAVLSAQLYEAFARVDQDDRTTATRKGLWQHSLAAACAAGLIGERIGGATLGGEAFVCGLLHDIGKIALQTCLPKGYIRVVEAVERRRVCICDVEREVLGLDHTVAGKRLAGRWKLPQPVLECVWLHHQDPDALPSSVTCGQLVHIVHLTDNLIRRLGIGFSGYQFVADVEDLGGRLGLNASSVAEVVAQIPEKMQPFCELIGLNDLSGGVEATASLAAANKQLGELNSQLAEANRRLKVRSACFAALEQFTKGLTENDTIGDVCVSAAESIRTMVGAAEAVALVSEASGRCVYAGYVTSQDRGQIVLVDDPVGPDDGDDPVHLVDVPRAGGFVGASDNFNNIWKRCTGSNPREPVWILPLVAGDSVIGAVLVATDGDAIRRFRSAEAESDALSAAMGLALGSAKARVESERLNEELLDMNRRLSAAQRELVHARSMSMIAAMAAGAAHELNNPLSVVSGRAQMELAKCKDAESARALQIIVQQTERATQIVLDLMRFAKPEPPQPVVQPLGALLESLCQHWRKSCSLGDEQVTLSVADPRATVFADAKQLDEILDAVMANAVEAATRQSGRLNVNSPSRASDETVRIVVEDNGVGMTPEVLEHALDPFFSSRPAGRGRGLGLSRAYRLAEINGGSLSLHSRPNAGTTVTIELPARKPAS